MAFDHHFYASLPFADRPRLQTPQIVERSVFNLAKTGQKVTLLTGHSPSDFPSKLLQKAWQEFNFVIEEGRTYPFHETFSLEGFLAYLFEGFAAILIEGEYSSVWDVNPSEFWHQRFLGYFYVKPNYVGRSSHVCNGGFVVNHLKRGLGLGKEMGSKYLEYSPRLGYAYSVFNLVYESNEASWRIWDSLGFERIGYVKNVGALKGESKLVGAYIYGKDLQQLEENTLEQNREI